MKQPRRLTRAEKILLDKLGYDPRFYVCASLEKNVITLMHKTSGDLVRVELW